MSLEATNWAWSRKGLTPTQKLVLLALADCVNGSSEMSCFPGQETLADRCAVTERHIRNVLKELERRNLIAVENRPGEGSGRKSNLYRLQTGNRKSEAGNRKSATGNRNPSSA